MDLKRYEKTRYQNIYRHKKNRNYIISISKPKTSISLIDGNRIFDIDDAKKIRDDYNLRIAKSNLIVHTETFNIIWDKYIYHCENVTKQAFNTLKKKKNFYKSHYEDYFKDRKIKKILEKDIIDFINTRKTSDKVKNELLKIIKIFFNWCVRQKYIPFSPCVNVKNTRVKKEEMKYWLPEHLQLFLKALEKDLNSEDINIQRKAYLIKIFVLIGFSIGDRVGETRALTFGDVSKEYKTINIRHSINYDSKDRNFRANTKNYQSQRTVDVSDKLINEILEYQEFLKNISIIEVNDTTPIMINLSTHKPYSDSNIRNIFKEYIKDLKVPKIRLYDLRHTYVTTMFTEGWELHHISKTIGHKNFATTVDKYGHISDNTRKEMAKTTDKYY